MTQPGARRRRAAGGTRGGDVPRNFGQQTDNRAKYAGRTRLEHALLARFRTRMLATVRPLDASRILDAGCGEGHVTEWLADAIPEATIVGVDGRADAVEAVRRRNPRVSAIKGDLRALPFCDGTFDLVVCTEVLEHVADPREVLSELARVSSAYLFLTVPHEPFFRLGNLAVGRYRKRLGSTPGHIRTWGRRGFLRTVASEVDPLRWISLFPWQGVLGRRRTHS